MNLFNIKVDTISPKSNYISYNTFSIWEIPKISVTKYFIESSENIYFLALAMFQLLTYEKIGILPTYWSPSGPFSTLVPLLLCYILEVINLLLTYFTDLYKTFKYNYYKYVKVISNDILQIKKLKNIKVGDIILVDNDEIIPVDTILLSVESGDYSQISLSNLNGECDIICKEPILQKLNENSKMDIKIDNIKEYKNSIKKFNSDCLINDTKVELNNHNFIPGGSVNKGSLITVVVTQIGKSIRSYTSSKNEKLFKQNFIDNYITDSLTNYFIFLLGIYTLSITIQKNITLNIFNLIKTFIQSWILLNGIVPFSAKIIVMMNRGIQSYLNSTSRVDYINPNSIDNFFSIDRMICDKTGTITKNELFLTHISHRSNVIDIFKELELPFDLISKIVLSLHYKNQIYATEEDRVISDKIISLGTIIEQNKNKVSIKNRFDLISVDIFEMEQLQFDCARKMSSVIYKQDNKFYIITKGCLDSIESIICEESKEKFNFERNLFDVKYPYLRTIGIAFKEIEYQEATSPLKYEKDGKYTYLTILGIQDELQDNINETISYLDRTYKKRISICTGDRYETAMYIGKSLELLKENTITLNNYCTKTNISKKELSQMTFVFSSYHVSLTLSNSYFLEKFTYLLLNTHNFIGFSMIPKDKQFVSSIFEMYKHNIIAIGDGNNDIPMLKTSTVGIGVKNGLNSNVVSNSQITIQSFSDLKKVHQDSNFCYNQNYNSIYSVFYKIIMIHTLVYLFITNNDYNLGNVLFNFLEIQGNHLLWGIIPVIIANIRHPNITIVDPNDIVKLSFLFALINSYLIMKIKNYALFNLEEKRNILLLAIISINIKFLFIFGMRLSNIVSSFFSALLGIYYVFYM